MHVIDNGNNEIRGSRVERDAGGDENQVCLALQTKIVEITGFSFKFTVTKTF